jgi:hypothetical protein
MAETMGDKPAYPARSAGMWVLLGSAVITIGTSGAVASVDSDLPGVSAVLNGTGTYDLTYPAAPKLRLLYSIQKSPTPTVQQIFGTAIAATSGTATFKTGDNDGTVANPASGDELVVFFYGLTRG